MTIGDLVEWYVWALADHVDAVDLFSAVDALLARDAVSRWWEVTQ